MKCLLVGAGAVGQVFGYHLQRAGAKVAFLVKPKHEAETRRGLTLYPLNRRRGERSTPVRFPDYDVYTSAGEIARESWDYVLLCISSTALHSGDWLEELAGAAPGASLVCLQPGFGDVPFVEERVGRERTIAGAVAFLSYPAPMPGERLPEPGMAYWFPPLAKSPLSGDRDAVGPLLDRLQGGGLPATFGRKLAELTVFGSSLLQTQVLALECAGWDVAALYRDRDLRRTGYRAFREALAIGSYQRAVRPPRGAALLRPPLLRLVWRIAIAASPIDLERYFQLHFTKVRDQSLDFLATLIERGETRGLDTGALAELSRRLPAAPGGEEAAASRPREV